MVKKYKILVDGTKVPWETRTRNTSEGYVLLTPEEIAEEDARLAKAEAERPMNEWLAELAKFDSKMPRSLEDVIDAVGTANFDPFIVDIYNKKKAVREKKPK